MIEELVVVVILSLDKKEDTLDCLKSVANIHYSNVEIVLVDNGSADGTISEVKNNFDRVHIVKNNTNLGVAGGRNTGIKYANEKFDYKYLLFLDNDIVIKSNALSEMIHAFAWKENIGVVTPKCYSLVESNVIEYAGGLSVNLFTGKMDSIGSGQKDEGQFDEPKFVSASGGLFLVSKEIISKVGLFDEKFNPYGWEDVDFSLRVRKMGYNIFYNPKSIIYHKGGKKARSQDIDKYESSKLKNYFYLIRKHGSFLQILSITLIFPIRLLIILGKELLEGEFKIIYAQIHSILKLFK